MNIQAVPVGELQTNCYILSQGEQSPTVLLVDPGDEGDKILAALQGREVAAVLLTHGHFDHTGALPLFADKPLYIHEDDIPILNDPLRNGSSYSDDRRPRPEKAIALHEGDVVAGAGLRLTVLSTPGHTPGSVCYLSQDNQLLSGDTLFASGYGRTDLPGGSMLKMRQSLRRLFQYHGVLFYPGHGPAGRLQ